MTSVPITWYSTYDFEYEKDEEHFKEKKQNSIQASDVETKYFMANPELYSIGIHRECFSVKLLAKYIGYALWHALIAYEICLYAMNELGVSQSDGTEIGFWVGGMTTFGVCIFMANFLLGLQAKTYEIYGILMLFIGPIAYFFFYWVLNNVFVGDIACLFAPNFSIGIIWVAMLFCLIQQYAVEKAIQAYKKIDEVEDNLPGAK